MAYFPVTFDPSVVDMLKLLHRGLLPDTYSTCLWAYRLKQNMLHVFRKNQDCVCVCADVFFSFSHTVSAPSGPVSPCCLNMVSARALASCVAPGQEAWMSGCGGGGRDAWDPFCRTQQRQEAVIRTREGLILRSFFFSSFSCLTLQLSQE